jgi:hypothetical protein
VLIAAGHLKTVTYHSRHIPQGGIGVRRDKCRQEPEDRIHGYRHGVLFRKRICHFVWVIDGLIIARNAREEHTTTPRHDVLAGSDRRGVHEN